MNLTTVFLVIGMIGIFFCGWFARRDYAYNQSHFRPPYVLVMTEDGKLKNMLLEDALKLKNASLYFFNGDYKTAGYKPQAVVVKNYGTSPDEN